MKKYLFITHSYPAFHSANSLCDEEIIKARNKGLEIHVLCYLFEGQKKYEIVDGVTIHRTKKDWFWPIEKKYRDPEQRNKINGFLYKLVVRLRQLIYLPFFPNYDLIATRHLYLLAKKIIKKENISKIVSDYNGCDTLIAGMKAAKKTKTDFIPIFWDSLSFGFDSKYVSKKFNFKRKTKLEKQVLNYSLCSVMMNATKKSIEEKYNGAPELMDKIVFLDIPFYKHRKNIDSGKEISANHLIRFVYGGATKERNIKPLVESLSKTGLNMVFDFYTIDYANKDLLKLEQAFNFFHVHKALPKHDIEKEYANADILVNFGVRNPNTISCKIFDYFSFCKPVISTFSISNESCIPYIKKYPLGYLFNENDRNVDDLLLFIKTTKPKLIKQEEIDNLFKANTADYFWDSLSK